MPQPEAPIRPSATSILEGTRFAPKPGQKKDTRFLHAEPGTGDGVPEAPVPEHAAHRESKDTFPLGTAVGDVFRDLRTANKMAKEKFDGDSALMRTARGFITTGVGVGLEKSMDFVWDKVWQGDIPFYDKSKFGEGMAESMNKWARSSDLNARLYYLVKESTQDLSLAIFYNFLAFRSQPLLEKSKPQHLIGSLYADIVAAAALPSLPKQMKRAASESTNAMMNAQIDAMKDKIAQSTRTYFDKSSGQNINANAIRTHELMKRQKALEKRLVPVPNVKKPGGVENFFLNALHLSNPVTHLGADMIGSGVTTLIKNFREVRKVRGQKGGLKGREVYMPKQEEQQGNRRFGDRKPDYNQRKPDYGSRKPDYEQRKPEYDTREPKKVYYGQSKLDDLKKLEEYDLKGGL